MADSKPGTEPSQSLIEERAMILDQLTRQWEERTINNPQILTADLLWGMRYDCEELNMSDF